MPGYAASKGGIGQLTMALANEWASRGSERQRDRARLYRHRQYVRAASRCAAQLGHLVPNPR